MSLSSREDLEKVSSIFLKDLGKVFHLFIAETVSQLTLIYR